MVVADRSAAVSAKKVTRVAPDQLTLLTPLTPLDGAKKVKKVKGVTDQVPEPVTALTPWEAGAPPLDAVRAGVRHWRPIRPQLTDEELQADLDLRAGGPERAAAFASWQRFRKEVS